MLSLSFVSCYFVVRKKSRDMPSSLTVKGRRNGGRGRRSSNVQLFLDLVLRSLVLVSLALFAFACFKWRTLPPLFPNSLFGLSDGSTSNAADGVQRAGKPHSRTRSAVGYEVLEASVDITTKELYDDIKFENKYGGAWTQGWDVQYRGDEWNEEKLKVFVVPHSHNDPGWLVTLEEYYQQRTRHILSNIVKSLSVDHRRRFIWEEVSYLKRWWSDATSSEKNDFVRLVKNGQLEIVGGGWVMNDEANTHYFAIIEQMTAGNLWLLDNVGVVPRNAWAIDPFGHSCTMAYLLKRMGFSNMVIQRTHYEVKKALALEKSLEFRWRQSWDSGNTTDILCHMMPFYFYDIPHTCGPEPKVCCQFDFWRISGYSDVLPCPWGILPEPITPLNVKDRAEKLLDQYRKKSMLYKTNTLLVPLGDDFRYVNIREADAQFENYQKLFDYINSHPSLKARVKFGTLQEYFTEMHAEAGAQRIEFPSLAGDFFTYADRVHDYWSGYYVTRPFYKAVDRVLEETLRAANIIYLFTRLECNRKESCSSLEEFGQRIASATENLALFQHHDGVTGTAERHVVADYALRMHSSLIGLQEPMLASLQVLLSSRKNSNVEFQMEQARSEYNVLPVKKTVGVTDGKVHRVTVFNPHASAVEQVITVMVDTSSVCVLDHQLNNMESQVTPEWRNEGEPLFAGRYRAQWRAQLPPFGFQTYVLVEPMSFGSCREAVLAQVTVSRKGDTSICPRDYECRVGKSDVVEIFNELQTVGFGRDDGLLKWIRDRESGTTTVVEEDVLFYVSKGSGAYLFHPIGKAETLLERNALVIASQGPVMQEVYIVPRSRLGERPVTRSARVIRGERFIEMDYHVEMLSGTFDNKEIICRFRTGIGSERVFYSDSNGLQMIRRETYDKIPLQGNYYPMPSLAFLQGTDGTRFSVHSRQAVGVSSLGDGWLEMMLDRRLSGDDGRGLNEGILDNRPVNVVFHLLVEKNVSELPAPSEAAPRLPSLLSHAVGAQLNYQPLLFLGRPGAINQTTKDAGAGVFSPRSGLLASFPCDLHVVSLKVLRPAKASPMTELGLTMQRRGWDSSYGRVTGCEERSVDLFSLFKDVVVNNVVKSSINFVHDEEFGFIEQFHRKGVESPAKRTGLVDLAPMELKSFKLTALKD